jgi:hypothetical protein
VHSVVDRVCRCVRFAIAASRASFVPIADRVVHELVQGFAQYHYPPYLWCSRELARSLHVVPAVQPSLERLLYGITQTALAQAAAVGPARLMEVADMLDPYFEYAEVYVQSMPSLLVAAPSAAAAAGVGAAPAPTEPLLPMLMQLATAALCHLEGDAADPAIRFVRAVLESLGDDQPDAYRVLVHQLLTGTCLVCLYRSMRDPLLTRSLVGVGVGVYGAAYGASIVRGLITGVADTYSVADIGDVADTLYRLLGALPAVRAVDPRLVSATRSPASASASLSS